MPPPGQTRYSVLVVDDDEKILAVAREMLNNGNIEVVTARTSRDALQALQNHEFDLMVTDVILGEEISGIDLVRYARITRPELKSLFVSGRIGPVVEDPDRDDFVQKPFRGRELLGCVYELIRRPLPERERATTTEEAADMVKAAIKVAAKRIRATRGAAAGAVLVVDDDEAVMEVAATMLEDLGLNVLRATSGPAALRQIEENPGIVLLITDVVMPGMDGWELARAAKERNPEIKALYMSGYIKSRPSLPADEYAPVLPKPWRSGQLYEAVTQVLATR